MVPERISTEVGQLFQPDPANTIYAVQPVQAGQGYGQGYSQEDGQIGYGKQTGELTGQSWLPWLALGPAVLVTNNKYYHS